VSGAALVAPLDTRPPPRSDPRRRRRWSGVALLAVAVLGAVVWTAVYSPVGFQRFELAQADRIMDFRDAGDYVVYEEHEGASLPALPSPLEVEVTGIDGGTAEVVDALPPGERGAPDAYELLGREGRTLARFSIDEPGSYRVRVVPRRLGAEGDFGRFRPTTLAVAPAATTGWLGSWQGAAALAGVPAVVGIVLVASTIERRRRRATVPAP
jgi:hypothetical protein